MNRLAGALERCLQDRNAREAEVALDRLIIEVHS
jgi:hypothetical protein